MGNTRDTGYLQNLLTYDVDGNIVLPANLIVNGNLLVATQSYVTTQINNLINGAPALLDTLDELAAALGDDANFASTITTSIAGKLSLTGGTLTGPLNGTSSSFSSTITAANNYLINNATASKKGYTFQSPASNWGPQLSGLYFTPNNSVDAKTTFTVELWNGLGSIITPLTITDTGTATFISSVTVASGSVTAQAGNFRLFNGYYLTAKRADGADINILGFPAGSNNLTSVTPNDYNLQNTGGSNLFSVSSTGAATFSSSVTTATFLRASSGAQSNPTGGASVAIDYQSTADLQGRIRSRDWDGGVWKNLTLEANNIILSVEGNVGIGTASPSTILDVRASAPTLTLRDSRTSGTWSAGVELGKLDFFTSDVTGVGAHSIASIKAIAGGVNTASPDGNLIFSTGFYNEANPTERMRITSSGNVGIGTDSPSTTLNIGHANHGIGISYIPNSSLPSIAGIFTNTSFGQQGYGSLLVKSRSDYAGYSISFYTAGTANVIQERARITSDGAIYSRFGQSGTTARLDITPNLVLEGQSGVSSGRAGISLLSNGAAYGIIMFGSSTVTNTDGFVQYLNDTRQMVLGTADAARVWINSSGNVGINNNSPSHRLHVSGNIYCTDTVYGRNILPDPWAYVTAGSPSGAPIPQGYSAIEVNSPCDNVWRPVLSNINDSKVFMWVTLGDASSKDTASYTWQMTSVAYGVANMTNLTYMDGGWNTGGFEFTYDTSGNNYRLLVRSTSYYSSGNTANGKIYFLRLQ